MQVLDDVYFHQYQVDSVSARAIEAYDAIADEIVKMLRPRSAVDVGCGGGALLRGLRNHGVPHVVGLEGSSHAISMTDGILHHDLRQPFDKDDLKLPWGGGDLVTCFDVGEHIEAEFHPIFVETIVKCLAPGGTLLFGAATVGQDGLGHVSCRDFEYWIEAFECKGLKYDPSATKNLKANIAKHEEHSFIWWCEKNLLLFWDHRGRKKA